MADTSPPSSKSGSKGLILVSEDDATTLRLLGQVMQRGGYQVALAADGIEAVKHLKTARPDLIILDLKMPNMDGFALMELLHKYQSAAAIPILVLTGSRDAFDFDRALSLDVTDYLLKPISPKALLIKVRQVLKHTK